MRRQKPAARARARSTLDAKKRNGINPKSMKSETRPRIAQQRGRVVANQRAAPGRRVQRVPSESGQWTESAQRAATAPAKEPDTKKKATRRYRMEWSVSGVWRLESEVELTTRAGKIANEHSLPAIFPASSLSFRISAILFSHYKTIMLITILYPICSYVIV